MFPVPAPLFQIAGICGPDGLPLASTGTKNNRQVHVDTKAPLLSLRENLNGRVLPWFTCWNGAGEEKPLNAYRPAWALVGTASTWPTHMVGSAAVGLIAGV